jgi:hypothetical protein
MGMGKGMGTFDLRAVLPAVVCLCALPLVRAEAQPATSPAAPWSPDLPATTDSGPAQVSRPWANGVPEAEQALATELYVAGNQEFTESHFAQALAKYREAIGHWDHPAIRYNIAVCLINLDQPVEAHDHLEKSLAYGAAPLNSDTYREGLTHRKLLEGQLAHLTVVSAEPGTEIALDGKLLFTGPGRTARYLLPGEHRVVATKPGFLIAFTTLVLVAGKRITYDVPALERKPTTRIARRWDGWKPWALIAGGAALGGIGGLTYLAAKRDLAAFDRDVDIQCPSGCTSEDLAGMPGITGPRDRGRIEQGIAFTLFSLGGVAMLTGAVGVVLNQPRVVIEVTRPAPVVTLFRGDRGDRGDRGGRGDQRGITASVTWRY